MVGNQAEFDLAERAARFGYWRVRLADGLTVWSPGMYRLLGRDPATPPDTQWLLEQIVDEDVAQLNMVISNAIKSRAPFYYRTRTKDPNHPTQFSDTHGEVEIGPDGRVVSVIGVCSDVTQQVLAETARAEAEERYRVMAKEASEIVLLYEPDGRISMASSALRDQLGLEIEDIEGRRYLSIIHPDDLTEAEILRGAPGPGETRTATYRVRNKNGQYVWMEATTRSIFDENGALKHMISVSRNVSERKAHELKMRTAQENAEAASKAKSGFLASMSHELRTPLNAIIGFASIMREEMYGNLGHRRYCEYASLIHDSGQHLLDLISDILDMAKIEAGKLELNFERVDLAGTVEDCARLLAERARERGIEIVTEVPELGLPLVADRRALKQILLNLLSNAVKFTTRGGHVWVTAKENGQSISICVRDDGVGIPAHALPRLGRAFEQVSSDPMVANTGTGLGLALVRALAERHGGGMTIESIEGEGTSVTVTLARVPAAEAAA